MASAFNFEVLRLLRDLPRALAGALTLTSRGGAPGSAPPEPLKRAFGDNPGEGELARRRPAAAGKPGGLLSPEQAGLLDAGRDVAGFVGGPLGRLVGMIDRSMAAIASVQKLMQALDAFKPAPPPSPNAGPKQDAGEAAMGKQRWDNGPSNASEGSIPPAPPGPQPPPQPETGGTKQQPIKPPPAPTPAPVPSPPPPVPEPEPSPPPPAPKPAEPTKVVLKPPDTTPKTQFAPGGPGAPKTTLAPSPAAPAPKTQLAPPKKAAKTQLARTPSPEPIPAPKTRVVTRPPDRKTMFAGGPAAGEDNRPLTRLAKAPRTVLLPGEPPPTLPSKMVPPPVEDIPSPLPWTPPEAPSPAPKPRPKRSRAKKSTPPPVEEDIPPPLPWVPKGTPLPVPPPKSRRTRKAPSPAPKAKRSRAKKTAPGGEPSRPAPFPTLAPKPPEGGERLGPVETGGMGSDIAALREAVRELTAAVRSLQTGGKAAPGQGAAQGVGNVSSSGDVMFRPSMGAAPAGGGGTAENVDSAIFFGRELGNVLATVGKLAVMA